MAMKVARLVSDTLWNENIWLPPNITWQHFESNPHYAQFNDLLYTIPLALLLVVARKLVEGLVFRPLGQWIGIKSVKVSLPPTEQKLEEAWLYPRSTRPTSKQLLVLSETTGLSERQIERWFRRRSKASRLSPLDKFCETGWRWVFYLSAHVCGVYFIWDKPWVWNTAHCWYNYPFHEIDPAVWWYYMVQTAFYGSVLVSQFADVKRKDFLEMFIHHIATLSLLVLSWTNHMHRMGSLVLLLHDFVDHWLELAKLAVYSQIRTGSLPLLGHLLHNRGGFHLYTDVSCLLHFQFSLQYTSHSPCRLVQIHRQNGIQGPEGGQWCRRQQK